MTSHVGRPMTPGTVMAEQNDFVLAKFAGQSSPATPSTSPRDANARQSHKHILTIAVEEYFQASAFRSLITSADWYRFEPRIERSALRTLDLLDEHEVKASFFTLGWVADRMPEVVREIARRGHEVACKGYFHRTIQEMTAEDFREDTRRARTAIENATGERVIGYRAARGHIGIDELWALDILADEGFVYDSSFYPRLRSAAREPWRRFAFTHRHGAHELREFPLATGNLMGLHLPIAGGAYLRHMPHWLISDALQRRATENASPLVMYFHTWELDDDLPRITAARNSAQLKQYRNLHKMEGRLRFYLERYAFASVREYLDMSPEAVVQAVDRAEAPIPQATTPSAARTALTLVVPCFNEAGVLPSLAATLRQLSADFATEYEFRYVFVDDGSADATWLRLQELFGERPDVRLVRHERNRGLAAAILTGITHAETEIVCSVDSDCSYDPHQLAELVPLLEEDVAVVTASPYHPAGLVRNVPRWRLLLSKGLSLIYRSLFSLKLHTYTSCFRAYRRSRVMHVQVTEGGYLGVAEMLLELDREGARILEQPAVLECRLLGHSKMKVARTVGAHLGLIGHLLAQRLRGTAPPAPTITPGR